jgi:membrane dipeptidase
LKKAFLCALKSGLTAVGLTIPVPGEDMIKTLPKVQEFLEIIVSEPAFCLADSPQAIREAHQSGEIAHIFLSQDSLFIGFDPKSLYLWKQLGLRVCQPTYNEKNLVGNGCFDEGIRSHLETGPDAISLHEVMDRLRTDVSHVSRSVKVKWNQYSEMVGYTAFEPTY